MTGLNVDNRTIFCHDNLDVLQGINSGSVDLIYLDPPFNKNKRFTAPVGSSAFGAHFDDIFREEDVKDEWLQTIKEDYLDLHTYLDAIKIVGKPYNFAYLAYMGIRLLECRRILKGSGSIYLHCDPTMSHYLKTVMDCIFGEENFRNEIVWKRYAVHSLAGKGFDTVSDSILVYAKSIKDVKFNRIYGSLSEEEILSRFPHIEKETGERYQHIALEQSSNNSSAGEVRNINGLEVMSKIGWRWSQETFNERLKANPHLIYWTGTGRPRYKKYASDYTGSMIGNIWTDLPYLSSNNSERLGYPTQKPLALLDRIIKASSNEGDMVLDPFCGCATTCVAAEHLGRKWIGIDVSRKAYDLVKERLTEEAADPTDILKHKNEIIFKTEPPKRTDQGDDHREHKWVYVISNPSYPGEYKVGIARDPKARLNQYQTGSPDRAYKIEFQHQTPAFRETEDHIHTQFDNKHEWVTGDLEAIINAIKTFKP